MIYDWHARHRITDKQAIDRVTNGRDEFRRTTADTRVRLLAQAVVTDDKAYAQSGERNRPAGMKLLLHTQRAYDQLIGQRLSEMERLGLRSPNVSVSRLPVGSWFLRIDFTLAKPYVSKDDESFYVIDNPLKKEKVFRVPYVAAPTWKGNLREALRLRHDWNDADDTMRQLLGNPREVEENFRAGRLIFFPTFFDRIDLEVLNPHKRDTGAGTVPIYLEVAPIGSSGAFHLLYIPFDQLEQNGEERCKSPSQLFAQVAQGIEFMLIELGFAAKKSSGFGVADPNSVSGRFQVNDSAWKKQGGEWKGFKGLTDLAQAWAKTGRAKEEAKQ
jgi:CRISPR-associated protein Cmr2